MWQLVLHPRRCGKYNKIHSIDECTVCNKGLHQWEMGNFKDPSTPYPRGRINRNNSRGRTQERGMRPLSRNRTNFKRGRRYEGRDNRPGSRCSRDNMGEWLRATRKPGN
jgi:hypothetical protein